MLEVITTFFSTTIAKIGVMAFFGALASTIKAKRSGNITSFSDFILFWVMSAFFGVVIGFIGLSFFKENIWMIMAMSGTGGWLGTETTNFLKEWLKNITSK